MDFGLALHDAPGALSLSIFVIRSFPSHVVGMGIAAPSPYVVGMGIAARATTATAAYCT